MPRPRHQPCPASASSPAVITASSHRSPVPHAAALPRPPHHPRPVCGVVNATASPAAAGSTMPRLRRGPSISHVPWAAASPPSSPPAATATRSPVPRLRRGPNYQLLRPLVLPPSAPLRPQSYTPEPPSRNTKKQKSDERSHLPSLFLKNLLVAPCRQSFGCHQKVNQCRYISNAHTTVHRTVGSSRIEIISLTNLTAQQVVNQ